MIFEFENGITKTYKVEEIFNKVMGEFNLVNKIQVTTYNEGFITLRLKYGNLIKSYYDNLCSNKIDINDWNDNYFSEIGLIYDVIFNEWHLSPTSFVLNFSINHNGLKNFVLTANSSSLLYCRQIRLMDIPRSSEHDAFAFKKYLKETLDSNLKNIQILSNLISNETIVNNIEKISELTTQRNDLIEKSVALLNKELKVAEDF